MQQGITKRTQINSSLTDIKTSLMPGLHSMNDGTECVENQSAHSIPPLPHIALIH